MSIEMLENRSLSSKQCANEIPPSVNSSLPPDFHKMDDHAFEEMSCAIYQNEPGISTADLYRIKFQKQCGIDLIAVCSDGSGVEVASCKCFTRVQKGEIHKWSDDFLNHWDNHWQQKMVKKFVLIVACDINSKERETEIETEKKRFEKIIEKLMVGDEDNRSLSPWLFLY